MPSTSTVIGELSIEESEALKALLSLGTCVISEMGGPVLNPATPTIPTTEPLHVESGSLDNSENTDTSKNQCLNLQYQFQIHRASLWKNGCKHKMQV